MTLSALWRLPVARILGAVIVLVGAGSTAFILSRYQMQSGGDYQPRYELSSGDELVAVFIGASFCPGSKTPGFPEAVRRAIAALDARADSAGRPFSAVGVSLDWDVKVGLQYLEDYGPFDQLMVGSNWTNYAAVTYMWRDLPGQAGVPQLLLVTRSITVAPQDIHVGEETLLARKIGTAEIIKWVEDGVRIHALAATRTPS